VEVFGDDVNLLLRLGRKRGKRQCFIDSDGSRLGSVLLGIAIGGHMFLHYPRNKRNRKKNQIKK